MTRASLLLLLLAIGAGPAVGAVDSGDRKAVETFLARVTPRTGVRHRSLVVVPLALADGVAAGESAPASGTGLAWRLPGKAATSKLVRIGPAPKDPPPRLLPAGLLLGGGVRERILSRPLVLAAEEECVVAARPADHGPGEAGEKRSFGAIAPYEQRKLDWLEKDPEVLEQLLRIQEALAGTSGTGTSVADLFGAERLKGRLAAARDALDRIPGAYGGTTAGHVAFLGLNPVEIVLFAEPKSYRAFAPAYLDALALSTVLWEEYYGRVGPELPDVDPDSLTVEAGSLLRQLRAAAVHELAARGGEEGGGRQLALLAEGAKGVPAFAARLALDAAEAPALLDGYANEGDAILPAPLDRPGGKAVDARPDIKGGAMTEGFLRRFLTRMSSRRIR